MEDILTSSAFWIVAAIIFGASMFQGATGFGMGILSVPLIFYFYGKHAVPITNLAAMSMVVVIAWSYRKDFDLKRTLWLAIPTMLAVPIGARLLRVLSIPHLKIGVGLLLVALSLHKIWTLTRQAESEDSSGSQNNATLPSAKPFSRTACVLVGLTSGVVGGATDMVGALLATYLIRSTTSSGTFKSTINVIYLAAGLIRLPAYRFEGLLPNDVLLIGALLAIAAFLGSRMGVALDSAIPAQRFVPLVNGFLMLLGIYMTGTGWSEQRQLSEDLKRQPHTREACSSWHAPTCASVPRAGRQCRIATSADCPCRWTSTRVKGYRQIERPQLSLTGNPAGSAVGPARATHRANGQTECYALLKKHARRSVTRVYTHT